MSEEYKNPENIGEEEEYDENIIILTDENGEEAEFEYLDSVEYEGREYVVLYPVDDEEEDNEVIILVVEEYDEDTDEETFGPVEDEETLNKVFELFKEAHKDEYNFND